MHKQYGDILIREAVPGDAEQLCAWWNDGSVMAHAGFPLGLGITVETVRAQLAEKGRSVRHVIEHQGVMIGEMNYRLTDAPDTCEIGIKICDASRQNRGLGKVILSLFIRTLFDELGFRRIILDTNMNNLRAQHVYEQLGFRKVRVNTDSWTDQLGRKQSSVDYELAREWFVSYL